MPLQNIPHNAMHHIMVTRINTVAFEGVNPILVDVQVHIAAGLSSFNIVGLADKAVAESKERIRAAFSAYGLALPAKRVTVNLSPADLPKEGNHYDVPIALAIMGDMGLIDAEELGNILAMGELALDGRMVGVNGILPAIMAAQQHNLRMFLPNKNRDEAAWAGYDGLYACDSLLTLYKYFQGKEELAPITHNPITQKTNNTFDFAMIKGQLAAKRAMEIAAAGGHNILLSGPPGAGKSLLAKALQGILPPMSPQEALQTSMIHSVAGLLPDNGIVGTRPFREPHHTASVASIVGGGQKAKPGELSLAHNGILFLDEIAEFPRQILEALRQPLETNNVSVSRVHAHITYPASIQMVAAMNPCKCGYFGDEERECHRVPLCAKDYQSKLSGPLLDRIDLFISLSALPPHELAHYPDGEASDNIAARVLHARNFAASRFQAISTQYDDAIYCNAHLNNHHIDSMVTIDVTAQELLTKAAQQLRLSARAWYKIIKVARTIADLASHDTITKHDMAEAITYRQAL